MTRVGLGYDVHAFAADRPLMLGGVLIPGHPGLAGHSDADVVCHAVADAVLGAAGLGDLGERFPASERWRDASSVELLIETARLLRDGESAVVNVDVTVIAQTPRLSDYRDAMIGNIAGALQVDRRQVSVKSTTTDGLGAIGEGHGIAALAVVAVETVASRDPYGPSS